MGPGATVALALLAGSLACGPPAHASTIVYVCGKDLCRSAIEQPGRIVVFDARTARPLADLTTGEQDSGPVFSPDAKRVAFTRGGSIWTVPSAGGKAKRLVARGSQPAWGR